MSISRKLYEASVLCRIEFIDLYKVTKHELQGWRSNRDGINKITNFSPDPLEVLS
jgi:hypothetical protein